MKRRSIKHATPQAATMRGLLEIGTIVLAILAALVNLLWLVPVAVLGFFAIIDEDDLLMVLAKLLLVGAIWIAGLCTANFFWLNGHSNRETVKRLRNVAAIAHACLLVFWVIEMSIRDASPMPVMLIISLISLVALVLKPEIPFGRGACPNCGYDLRGNASGACPECGSRVRVEKRI